MSKKVLIVAGEASGDLHGSRLVREMKARRPALTFFGVGGKRMAEAGVELTAQAADMAVVGISEVMAKLPRILKVMGRLKGFLRRERPDLAILIDYPDFNLPLAGAAHRCGCQVLYYISPQVWAWRPGRLAKIRRFVDRLAVILPFEEEFYRRAGLEVSFVGHPLLDEVKTRHERAEARRLFGLQDGLGTVGLLPGSRPGEVELLLPEMLAACRLLSERLGGLQFILPLAETIAPELAARFIAGRGPKVTIVRDGTYDALALCDVALVASGTATLEAALLKTPMVVLYKVSPLSFAVGRRFVHVPHIALPNLIAGRAVVPELIQGEARAERIAREAARLLADEGENRKMRDGLAEIRARLGEPGAAGRVADLACGMLDKKGSR